MLLSSASEVSLFFLTSFSAALYLSTLSSQAFYDPRYYLLLLKLQYPPKSTQLPVSSSNHSPHGKQLFYYSPQVFFLPPILPFFVHLEILSLHYCPSFVPGHSILSSLEAPKSQKVIIFKSILCSPKPIHIKFKFPKFKIYLFFTEKLSRFPSPKFIFVPDSHFPFPLISFSFKTCSSNLY